MNSEIVERLERSLASETTTELAPDHKYRIMFLESEVLARQADLIDMSVLIEELAMHLPSGALDEFPAIRHPLNRLRKRARTYFVTPDEEAKLSKERRERLAAIVAEINSRTSGAAPGELSTDQEAVGPTSTATDAKKPQNAPEPKPKS